ncbi:HAD family hydrolase [Sulfobacillus harzensis]|uniref:HAD family hydrolase n=1 Tax=Sulfobacillus harzensis TaxID=2729629 RepID=A0A7Y0L5A3_9FIRM|nr:HAD family hydrolase [Sulfobacillus harzensis]NMP22149.1 HAD family hydrolase [Sulfobacillus harzensis]
MNLELRQVADGVYATSRAAMQVEVADVVVFDMDGVLMDVRHSYPVVICKAVDRFLRESGFTGDETAVTPDETAYFKAAGGFNSDWALAQGVVLIYLVKAELAGSKQIDGLRNVSPDLATVARSAGQYGGGLAGLENALAHLIETREFERLKSSAWDRARITRLAQEFYAGDRSHVVFGVSNDTISGDGLMLAERPLIDRNTLLSAPFRYGLYTGRNRGEVETALDMAHLGGVFAEEALVTETLGIRKPDPAGLFRVAEALKPKLMIYAGDNLDDWQTAARYEAERGLEEPPCVFCGVLGGSPGPLGYSLFQERGVDLMTKSVQALLAWVTGRKQRIATI